MKMAKDALEIINEKIHVIEQESGFLDRLLSEIEDNADISIGQDEIVTLAKRDANLASRIKEAYDNNAVTFKSFVSDISDVINVVGRELSDMEQERDSMMIPSKIIDTRVILYIDKDFIRYRPQGRNGKNVSDDQDSIFDLLGVLGGATEKKEMTMGRDENVVISARCHDLGFPFYSEYSFAFSVYLDGIFKFFSQLIDNPGIDFIPICDYEFVSMEKDAKMVQIIFLDMLRSSGIKLAAVDSPQMQLMQRELPFGRLSGMQFVQDGVFISAKELTGWDADDYKEAFTRVLLGGKCSVK
jgi:hypothetical protein